MTANKDPIPLDESEPIMTFRPEISPRAFCDPDLQIDPEWRRRAGTCEDGMTCWLWGCICPATHRVRVEDPDDPSNFRQRDFCEYHAGVMYGAEGNGKTITPLAQLGGRA